MRSDKHFTDIFCGLNGHENLNKKVELECPLSQSARVCVWQVLRVVSTSKAADDREQ